MVAACPFPVNYGSPAAIRELSETLSEMGHDIHIVTYPHGQDLTVGQARLHRVARNRRYRAPSAGPTGDKLFLDFLMLAELCRVVWREKIEIIHAHNYERAPLPPPIIRESSWRDNRSKGRQSLRRSQNATN